MSSLFWDTFFLPNVDQTKLHVGFLGSPKLRNKFGLPKYPKMKKSIWATSWEFNSIPPRVLMLSYLFTLKAQQHSGYCSSSGEVSLCLSSHYSFVHQLLHCAALQCQCASLLIPSTLFCSVMSAFLLWCLLNLPSRLCLFFLFFLEMTLVHWLSLHCVPKAPPFLYFLHNLL